MLHTVLSVDADPAGRRMRHDLRLTAGFSVIEAAAGPDTSTSASDKLPALIVLATELAGLDGPADCKRLKSDPRTVSIPVLNISRAAFRCDYPDSLESGADAYLSEPGEPTVLTAVAETLTHARRPSAAEGIVSELLDSVPDEVWFTDAQGRPMPANQPALREFGAHESTNGAEVLRADGTARPAAEATPLRALRGEMVQNEEEIVRTPDLAHSRCRLVSAAPAKYTGGKILGAVSVARDITERRRAEQALREGEKRCAALFETMSEGLAVNPAFGRQTGLKSENILGRITPELFPDAEPVWFERYCKVALTGAPARFEQWFAPLDRCFEVSAFRTEPGRFDVVFTDITERKRTEAERHPEARSGEGE